MSILHIILHQYVPISFAIGFIFGLSLSNYLPISNIYCIEITNPQLHILINGFTFGSLFIISPVLLLIVSCQIVINLLA